MTGPNGSRGRLKSLDLQGYKTFASKSVFEFAPGITAIVGPNGSGKSNIADSIRWVLGEQSYSLLRGKKTEDMIFSGSEQRARASMATATITFDNDDGWLPIDFSEVTVSRRAYRSGENEYLLNGQRVRLRDVAELLAQCGLGERTYTIIGQGLVDAALSLKAEERRKLFEEAAGIGLYRGRREESLRRLDHTRRNLDRVRDILAELRPRLRSLERQAKRARDYEQVRQDLYAALRQLYGYQWSHMLALVADARRIADEETGKREALHTEERATSAKLDETRIRIDGLRVTLQELSHQASALYRDREQIGRTLAVSQERLRWLAEQVAGLQGEVAALNAADETQGERLESARREVTAREQAAVDAETQRRELLGEAPGSEEPGEAALDPAHARVRLESLRAEIAANEARRAQALKTAETAALEADRARQRAERSRADLEGKGIAASQQAKSSEGAATARSMAEAEAEKARAAMDNATRQVRARQADLAEAGAGLAVSQARLAQAEDAPETDANSLLEGAAARGELHGWRGRLRESIRPERQVERAVHAALGAFADGFGFDSQEDLLRAVSHLGEGEEGASAAMLTLGSASRPARLAPPSDPDVVGNAAALAGAGGPYRDLIEALLGQTLVVRDRAAATRLIGTLPDRARLVTLKGDVFLPGGHILLNAARPYHSLDEIRRRLTAAVARAESRVREAQGALAASEAEAEAAEAALRLANESLAAARTQEQGARDSLAQARSEERVASGEVAFAEEQVREAERRREAGAVRVAEEDAVAERLAGELRRVERVVRMDDVRQGGEAAAAHLAHADTTVAMARAALTEASERLADLEAAERMRRTDRESRTARLAALVDEQDELGKQVAASQDEARGVEERLAALEARTAPAEASLATGEEERTALERKESELRLSLQAAERRHSQAQIDLARRQEELASLRRRVEDDFGLVAFDPEDTAESQTPIPFEGLVEHLPQVDELPPEFEGQVGRLRLQLRRMGAINPEAQKEFTEVRERVEFLTSQVDDLEQAEGQLQGVIAELDVQMETEFQKTFEAVSKEFKDVFTRLFGGGSVRLTLTDPGDLSQTGIDIEARLPGRREQGLAMLSGGERSLTACALVFALLRVSPTPFCVLDEVDAMLDESNVARFREMLKELSVNTQFVIITHNRQTVQAAQVLYGVSMGADSASRVISLQLDEAEREMEQAELR
jgi:chromosome segregation protein